VHLDWKLLHGLELHDGVEHGVGSAYQLDGDIGHTATALSSRLWALEEQGQTALGPALVVAVAMAARTRGSRVVVCTDGKGIFTCALSQFDRALKSHSALDMFG
jgi:hypothetical protein